MHRWLRALLVYALGIGLILFGIVGLFLPLHPGLVVIAVGLGVLSLESKTARRARTWFLDWLAERDLESERLRRWRARAEDLVPDEDEEDQARGSSETEPAVDSGNEEP